MISLLLESAARSMGLAIVVWIGLRLFRIKAPQDRLLAWTAVLLSAVTMPVLMKVMQAAFIAAPSTAAWMPTAPSSLFLPQLATTIPVERASSLDAIALALTVYLLVAVVLLVRLAAGVLQSRRLLREALPLHEPWIRGCDVRVSRDLTIPVTVASTILIPSDWPQWNTFTQQAVLLHERAHVRRRDFYTHLLASLHRAVFWFSPLGWWLQSHLLELAEAASDDEALTNLKDRVSYAELLVDFARKGSRSGFVGVGMARGRTVARRVERMLGDAVDQKTSVFRRALLVAVLVPLVGLSAGAWLVRAESSSIMPLPITSSPQQLSVAQPAVSPQAAPGAPQPARPPQAQEARQYLSSWIEQEVPDIAAPEERDAFHSLKTDEEREKFIESFWLRRDPTPGTVDNEYRDEYYRRIALTNKSFGTKTGIPGWLTDRGRILIRFGEPDEVETHAIGEPPFERWRYRYIEGIGNNVILGFVDTTRNGTYRLQEDPTEKESVIQILKKEPAPQK